MRNCIIDKICGLILGHKEIKILDKVAKLHEKENQIFRKTIKIKEKFGEKANILDWEFYDFQMLVELLERFWPKEKIILLWEIQHELMLSYRFMLIGYYNSAGKHLRSFMEHSINYLHDKPSDTRKVKIEKVIQQSTYKQEELLKLDAQQVYMVYGYLSNNYTHYSDPFDDLDLDVWKLSEIKDLIIVMVLISARLIFWVHGKLIEDHYHTTVKNPVEYEKSVYWPYIQTLLSDVRFYNTMMGWWLWKKIEDKKWNLIDMTLRVDQEYHETRKHSFK